MIEIRKLETIKPYDRNPRQNDAAVDAVAESIRQFGFRQPIVVDSEGVIVCGHTRFKAAQKLGLAEVPVHVAADLTPEQIKAYRIADNKTADLAEWDFELLPIELSELQGMDIPEELKPARYYEPVGCDDCRGTGYRGRTGVHELLLMTDEFRQAFIHEADLSRLREIALNHGMVPMAVDALEKAREGITSLSEVMRVVLLGL